MANNAVDANPDDRIMLNLYVPPMKTYNLSVNGVRVKSSDKYEDCYIHLDVVAKAAASAGVTWAFTDNTGRSVSY